jgi:uncharacterized membrane-anchored protein
VIEKAAAALADGGGETARIRFEAAPQQEESPEGLFGLWTALWWLGETEAAVRAQERAYAAFRKRLDAPSAVLAAIALHPFTTWSRCLPGGGRVAHAAP